MKFLSIALLSGAVLIHHPSLAQIAPPPSSPATPSATGISPAPAGTAATPAAPAIRQIAVASLANKDLRAQDDSALGDIERVVESRTDRKPYVVVSRGGLLGFFETEYLVPVDQIAVAGNHVVAKNMTQAQLESGTCQRL